MNKSILDTDLYKFTTSYAYMKMFPNAIGTFKFIDRENIKRDNKFLELLQYELAKLKNLKLTLDEKEFMFNNCKFIPSYYWEWLSSFTFDFSKLHISLDENGILEISITDYLYKATLYEVHILAIVSEIHGKWLNYSFNRVEIIDNLLNKIKLSNDNKIHFSEFGTRRRFSYKVQDIVIKCISENANYCNGTSNCHFAHLYNLKLIGTFPHEWVMFHGAIFGYKQANYLALDNWSNVYDGNLGIALTDTYTTNVFFDNLSKKHAKLFDGLRQDSGDEFNFINKAIKRYNELKINPNSKVIIFSNSLDFNKALEIKNYCYNRINCAFGIGTNLTNDTKFKPSNIVIKLANCSIGVNKQICNCVKLSDDLGKHTGDFNEVTLCKQILNIK